MPLKLTQESNEENSNGALILDTLVDKEADNTDGEDNKPEQESEVRTERPGFLDSFKDKLTEFLDNAE